MGAIAERLGGKISWDKATGRFTSPRANELVTHAFGVPQGVEV